MKNEDEVLDIEKKESNKHEDLFNIPDDVLEKWIREILYPAIKKLSARGIICDLR